MSTVIHLTRTGAVGACGRHQIPASRRTRNPREVTCGRCRVTDAYSYAMRQPVIQTVPEPSENRTHTQAVLDRVFAALHEWADDNGHCSDYDEAVEAAQRAVDGMGLVLPTRKRRYNLSIRTHFVMAESEGDAIDMVGGDPTSYLYFEED